MNGGGGKVGDRDEKEATSGGVATLHTLILETVLAGPSTRVRPRVTDGGGGKVDEQSVVKDARPGMGICGGRSVKYETCNMVGGGPRDEHLYGRATMSDRR